MDKPKKQNFDEEFDQAVAQWRQRHQLREDDAVLMLVELFRIHQQHWDELRRREIPSFEQLRADITKLCEAARTFQQQSTTLLEKLPQALPPRRLLTVSWTAALFAALAAGLGGYMIGRAWM